MAGKDLDLDKVDNTELGEDDLTDITTEIQDVAANFPLIGTALRLKSGDVKIIKKECFGDYRCGLEQVILLWLHQKYNVKRFGSPSWRTIVEVVDKSTGGNNHALAKRIAAAHQAGTAHAPKKPNKPRAGQVNTSDVQEAGIPTEDVSGHEYQQFEHTRADQANANPGYQTQQTLAYHNQYPNQMTYSPQMSRGQFYQQPQPPYTNYNPHALLREMHSEPVLGDHPPPQQGVFNPEGSTHAHLRRGTYPQQGHQQGQQGTQQRFPRGVQPRVQPGDQPTHYSQPAEGSVLTVNPTQGHFYHSQGHLPGITPEPQHMGAAGYSVPPPTAFLQDPEHNAPYPQQPTHDTSYLQQPMHRGVANTRLPTQGMGYPQEHVLNGGYTQQPGQGATYSPQLTQGVHPSGIQAPPSTQMAHAAAQPVQPQQQKIQKQPPQNMRASPIPQVNTGYEASGDNGQSEHLRSNTSYQPMSSRFNNPSEEDEPGFKPVHVGLNVSPYVKPSEENSMDSPSTSPQPASRCVVSPAPSSGHLSSTHRPSSPPPPALSHDTISSASQPSQPVDSGTSQSAANLPEQMAELTIHNQSQQSRTYGLGAQNSGEVIPQDQNQSGLEFTSKCQPVSSHASATERAPNTQQISSSRSGSNQVDQTHPVAQQAQTLTSGHHSLAFSVAKTPMGAAGASNNHDPVPHYVSGGQLDNPTLPSSTTNLGGANSALVKQSSHSSSESHAQPCERANLVLCPSGNHQQNISTIEAGGSQDLHSASGGTLDTSAESLTNSSLSSCPSDVDIVPRGGSLSESTLDSYSANQQPQGMLEMSRTANNPHDAMPPPNQTPSINHTLPSLANSTLPSLRSEPEFDRVAKPTVSAPCNLSEAQLTQQDDRKQEASPGRVNTHSVGAGPTPPAGEDQTDEEVHEKTLTLSMNHPSNVAGSSQHSQETPHGDPGKLALDSRTKPLQFHELDCCQRSRVSADGGNIDFQTYTHYDRASLKEYQAVNLSFGVVHPEKMEKQVNPVTGEYDMKGFPHGLMIIINNETFRKKEHKWREGTNVDEKNLITTFRYLGYNVEVHRNRNCDQMCEIFEDMKKRDLSNFDSFVCCILTHGRRNEVFGTDSESVKIESLTQHLCASSCPQLAGKPKLFFIQACRGKMRVGTAIAPDNGSEDECSSSDDDDNLPEFVTTDSEHPIRTSLQRLPSMEEMSRSRIESDSEIPDVSDFYFGYATPLGHVSWRDLDHGSWFVSELCRGLCTYGRCSSLQDIMTNVNDKVSVQYDFEGLKQAPETTSRLRRNVFFYQ